MEEHKLTVYNRRDAFKETPPQIILRDKWLKRAGSNAGNIITVDCQQWRLVITKDSRKKIPGLNN